MKKRISILACAISMSIAAPVNAFFILPPNVTDYISLAKEQLQTMQDQSIFYEKMLSVKESLEKYGVMKSSEVDTQNNDWTNKTIREGRRAMELNKIEYMAKSIPAFMPCGSVTNTILLKHINTYQDDYLENIKVENKEMSKVNSDSRKSNVTEKIKEALANTKAENQDLFTEIAVDDDSEGRAFIANSSLLISSNPDLSTLSVEQTKAMEGFVLLVAPPYEPNSFDRVNIEISKEEKIRQTSKSIKRNLVNQVFNRLLSKRISLGGTMPSELAVMDQLDKEIFSNSENYKETLVYKLQTSNLANPGQIIRNQAVLMAQRVHFSVQEYERNLSMESVLSNILLEKINN